MAGAGISYILNTALGRITEELCFNHMERPPVWMLGGSCGLLLHGVPLRKAPGDIDIYCDLKDVTCLHEALSGYAVSEPEADYSGSCFSLRSCYDVEGIKAELVSGFRMKRASWQYTVDIDRLVAYAPLREVPGIGLLRLMPLGHELIFNLMRGREERCSMISASMQSEMNHHMPLLESLMTANNMDLSFRLEMDELIGRTTSSQILQN